MRQTWKKPKKENNMKFIKKILFFIPICCLLLINSAAAHEHAMDVPENVDLSSSANNEPLHISMKELHRLGGLPPGWKFTMPAGDAEEGRQVFIKMQCFSCHVVQGEPFSVDQKDAKPGPNLTGMGSHHPPEYFAESILEPNEIIITGPGFTGPDGLSIMPSYRDTLTLQQWVDLVAYLKSLTGEEMEEDMQMEPKD
jgi:mono/diheme cytochrome c family protein